jgi:DNA-binding response OmpR family regulator
MKTTTETLRALLLDGDPTALGQLCLALGARGVEVSAAHEAKGGLELLLDGLLTLDVLVLDLDLPGRDGWSFLRLVRSAGGERDVGIVVLARGASPAVHAQLRALGADAVVERSEGAEAAARAVVEVGAARRFRLPCTPAWPRRFTDAALGALALATRPAPIAA